MKVVDRILYLIGKQEISYQGRRKHLETLTPGKIQKMSQWLFAKFHITAFYCMSTSIQYYGKTSPKSKLIDCHCLKVRHSDMPYRSNYKSKMQFYL